MDDIQRRKKAHLDLSLDARVQGEGHDLDGVELPYDALFEVSPSQIDMRTRVGEVTIDFPLMFGAMTGGTRFVAQFNEDLRAVARDFHLAVETGSIRACLEDEDLCETYGTVCVPALLANLGASELSRYGVGRIAGICDRLGAFGLCIHLNGLQEWVQDEGNHAFCCSLDGLERFVRDFPYPVFFKEVGSGIGGRCARRLASLPIAGLETASLGGTSWVKIEALRRKHPIDALTLEALSRLGVSLTASIRDCRDALGARRTVVASGGIRTPIDLIKCLYLGADLCAVSQPVYEIWNRSGREGIEHWVESWIEVGRLVWRSTGCQNLEELRNHA